MSTTDRELLDAFASRGDQASFEEIVRRHGNMVYSAALAILRTPQDAEDATQAAFLTLARKARSLRRVRSVGGWLHHVAVCVARDAHKAERRRRRREEEAAMAAARAAADRSPDVARAVLHDHVGALPERHRLPIVLHHLEERTPEESAAIMGCSTNAFMVRLTRARQALRGRIARRGAAIAGAVIAALSTESASAAMPPHLVVATAQAAVQAATGAATVSANVSQLTERALRMLMWAKAKTVASAVAMVCALGCATGTVALLSGGTDAPPVAGPGTPAAPRVAAPKRFRGPFAAKSLAFYVVHRGGPLVVELSASREAGPLAGRFVRTPPAIFAQFHDAEDRVAKLGYHTFAIDRAETRRFRYESHDAPRGVYQVRYVQSGEGVSVDLRTSPATSFGVMARRCPLTEGADGQFDTTHVYAPRGFGEITLRPRKGASVVMADEAGRELRRVKDRQDSVPVEAGHTYRLDLAFGGGAADIGFAGAPAILCPDAATAQAIHGSVEVAPDGTVLAHKWQVRMWTWMRALRASDLAVEPVDLARFERAWLADPRNAGLLGQAGPFNHVAYLLRHQDLDPSSAAYGRGVNAAWLGPAFVIDEPFNPYRRNPAVRNRILLHEFATLLGLKENGSFSAKDWDHYAGVDGLTTFKRHFLFGYVGPLVEPELRDLWFQGASSVLNRFALDRVSCENQTSHWMSGLYLLYQGSGREIYRRLAHDFAVAFYDPDLNLFMRTGYQQEKYGPDATYQGLSSCNQALYYKLSRDDVARDGLRTTYDLLNHTVAPEPDGEVFGASNFAHRTSGSWRHRQWGGGTHLMSDILPEAGLWHPDRGDAAAYRDSRLAYIRQMLRTQWDDAWYEANTKWIDAYALHPWTRFFSEYLCAPDGHEAGRLPVLSAERFDLNANDEFFFVRRPAYYAVVYTGTTAPKWPYLTTPKPVPYQAGWRRQKGVLVATTKDAKKSRWYVTQGLGLFWTPRYGNCILGKNWNAYTAQMLRADLEGGTVAWPDYWAIEHAYDKRAGRLQIRQQIAGLPIKTVRTLTFADDGVRVGITFDVSGGGVDVKRFVEQIPYLLKDGMQVRFERDGRWGGEPGDDSTRMWFGNARGDGVVFTFGDAVALRRGISSRNRGHDVGLIEVDLTRALRAGALRTLSYRIEPGRLPPPGGPATPRPTTKPARSTLDARPARRVPVPGAIDEFDALLRDRLGEHLDGGATLRLHLSSMHVTATVRDIDAEGVLGLNARGTKISIALGKLSLAERHGLASRAARVGVPADHAIVAFYALARGDEAATREGLSACGEYRSIVEGLFRREPAPGISMH